jgi:hypothetical protein
LDTGIHWLMSDIGIKDIADFDLVVVECGDPQGQANGLT